MADLLERYLGQLRPGASPIYKKVASEFCAWLGAREPDTAAVHRWMALQEKARYAAGTLRTYFGILSRIYKVNGYEVAFPRGAMPQVGDRDEEGITAEVDLIERFIWTSRQLEPSHRAFLAMATTFGLRRSELAELSPEDFDFERATVYVETRKRGRQRYHHLPPEILPFLQAYNWRPVSNTALSAAFTQIKLVEGLTMEQGRDMAWHSIRRALSQILEGAGFTVPQMNTFMRWKGTGMIARYSRGVVVGVGGARRQAMGLQDEEIDQRAFEANPWLKTWAEVQEET